MTANMISQLRHNLLFAKFVPPIPIDSYLQLLLRKRWNTAKWLREIRVIYKGVMMKPLRAKFQAPPQHTMANCQEEGPR